MVALLLCCCIVAVTVDIQQEFCYTKNQTPCCYIPISVRGCTQGLVRNIFVGVSEEPKQKKLMMQTASSMRNQISIVTEEEEKKEEIAPNTIVKT